MRAKSPKADGTPKKRWSAADRTDRGHAPRRRATQQKPQAQIPRPLAQEKVRPSAGDFGSLGLPALLVGRLGEAGITRPFPIQSATIPDALSGRDVLGRAKTGSGKTLAFGLPILSALAGSSSKCPRAVILTPTRELASQVGDVLTPLAHACGLSLVLVAGGMSYTPQLHAFERGVDIVVATPGRLIDLMERRAADLSRIEIAVLDEADHMADLGFLPSMTQILDAVPAGGQRLLFSATLDDAVDRLVRKYLTDPVRHEVDPATAGVTSMVHHVLEVAPKDKVRLTAEIAGRDGRTVVFVRTQRGADRVAEQLRDHGVLAGALHGGLAQGARTRVLGAFRDGSLPVLVATDVAARGIHVDDVGLVLHADPPGGPKEYLHRSGRTARAGGTGTVVTLVLPHQRREVRRLTADAGVHASPLGSGVPDRELVAATGARSASGEPISAAQYQRLIASVPMRRSGPGRRPGRGDRARGPARRPESRGTAR
jgi:superfamily II DNA/RNA helicase